MIHVAIALAFLLTPVMARVEIEPDKSIQVFYSSDMATNYEWRCQVTTNFDSGWWDYYQFAPEDTNISFVWPKGNQVYIRMAGTLLNP